ncbi:MAG: hypothetical protein HYV63_26760 [Candidatus Schekmanbacteria bacterium]|nr:hypothetical protein [Candidatus Schekmanbacteria bacterium]
MSVRCGSSNRDGQREPGGQRPEPNRKERRPAVGKRVHGALYVHRDAVPLLDEQQRKAITAAGEIAAAAVAGRPGAGADEWNVIKLEPARPERVTLLVYPRFAETAFPALLESIAVDLAKRSVAVRSFRHSSNPPILHRKELLLPPEHPDRPRFAALTTALEAFGLFADSRRIGLRKRWEELLAMHGIEIVGHEVCRSDRGPCP